MSVRYSMRGLYSTRTAADLSHSTANVAAHEEVEAMTTIRTSGNDLGVPITEGVGATSSCHVLARRQRDRTAQRQSQGLSQFNIPARVR